MPTDPDTLERMERLEQRLHLLDQRIDEQWLNLQKAFDHVHDKIAAVCDDLHALTLQR